MGSLSNTAEAFMLNHVFNTSQSPGSPLYLALCSSACTDAHTGVDIPEIKEACDDGYDRAAITFGVASGGVATITQDAQVTFPQATGTWATVSHWAVVSNLSTSAGTLWAHGAFAATFQAVNGNTPSIASGQVYIQLTNPNSATCGFTKGFQRRFLNLMFKDDEDSMNAGSTFLALGTATVAVTDTDMTEPSGNGYTRKVVAPAGWSDATQGTLANASLTTMPDPSGSWGNIVSFGIFDAASGGSLILYDNGVTDQTVGADDTVQFAVGAISVSLS